MFNPETDQEPAKLAQRVDALASDLAGLRDQLSGLEMASASARFVMDAKACAERADELAGLTVQAIEAKAAVENTSAQAQSEFVARAAALDKREAAIAELEVETAARRSDVNDKQSRLLDIFREIRTEGDTFKRQILRYAVRIRRAPSCLTRGISRSV